MKPIDKGHSARLPLEGIRVIDMGQVFSVPLAGSLLADMGAEVIKIEGPSRIDRTRVTIAGVFADNDPGADSWNRRSNYNILNRSKKSLVIDVTRPEGKQVLVDLIRKSDVLLENFTPRVMRSWGLDYPEMKKINPSIIMVSNSGYGRGDGRYCNYPAQATTQEATHGLAHVTGYRGGLPSKAGQAFVDFLACWACLMGVALGLRYRRRAGKGLQVDVGMYQLGCFTVGEYILDWQANGRLGERIGNRHPFHAPQGCYRCAGDDQWCVLSVCDQGDWRALCRLIGKPDWADDPRFANPSDRMRHHDEIDQHIETWTRCIGKFEAMERLQDAGVPAGAVFDGKDMHFDRHLNARGFVERAEFPPERKIGKRMFVGSPWQFARTPIKIRGPAPTFGQHNKDVLQNVLGYDERRCEELKQLGIVADRPKKIPDTVDAEIGMEERVRVGLLAYYDPDYKERLGIQGTQGPAETARKKEK